MGFMDKVKGWLNIGGPKVSIVDIEQPIDGKAGAVKGRFSITTKRTAKVVGCTQTFYVIETTGRGEEKKEVRTVIAERKESAVMELQADSTTEGTIHIEYNTTGMLDNLADKGGMLGALGKVGKFASGMGEKGIKDYFVEVACDVEGTPLDPADKMMVRAAID